MRPWSFAVLLVSTASCGPSDVAVQEEGRAEGEVAALGEAASEPTRTDLGGGLVLEVDQRGQGNGVRAGGQVLVHYAASAPGSDKPFDSSWSRGVPDRWDLSSSAKPRLIEGLRRGLVGLPAGSQVRLSIPAALAWGEAGLPSSGVPPGADLCYEIELLEVLP
jgi:peptidylprolyl isomerase